MAVPVYYRVLGLDPGAADQDIQDAFRRLATLYQPDGSLENALAARRLRLITEAYSVLGDPTRRAAYDAQLTGVLNRSHAPLSTPEVASDLSAEEPVPAPTAESPAEGSRRPTLLGRLRRRPFRSMGVVVAVTLVLLGAWVRPQHPDTDMPLGSPPSIVVPTAETPLVAGIDRPSPSAASSGSPRQARRSATGTVSSVGVKARPSATRGLASHSTSPGAATPAPTQPVSRRPIPSATPSRAGGTETPATGSTPASSPTLSRKPIHPRSPGGSDRVNPNARHVIVGTLAMTYEDYPNVPIKQSVYCAGPQRWPTMPAFQIGLQQNATGHPRQAGLQARALFPSPFRRNRPARLPAHSFVAWSHSPAHGSGLYRNVPSGRPQVRARIVRA